MNTSQFYFHTPPPDTGCWVINQSLRIYDLDWVDSYHRREFAILPGDSLQCGYKEIITADSNGSAAESLISIIRVYEVIPPKSAHSSAG